MNLPPESPAAEHCSKGDKCPNQQNVFDFKKWSWQKQCSAHKRVKEKELFARSYLWASYLDGDLPEMLYDNHSIAYDASALFAGSASAEVMLSTLKQHAIALRDELDAATGWHFTLRRTVKNTYGPSFFFSCCQDGENERVRDKKDRKTEQQKDGHRMLLYNCRGSFAVKYHLGENRAEIALSHECSHEAYQRFAMDEDTRQRIRLLWERGLLEGRGAGTLLYEHLLKDLPDDHPGHQLTKNQVIFELSRLNKAKFGEATKGESVTEEVWRMTRDLETLEVEDIDESGGIWERYWDVVCVSVAGKEAEELASTSREMGVDGTHGKIRGWELLGVLVEEDGCGYPISYLALRPSPERQKQMEGKKKSKTEYRMEKRTRFAIMLAWFKLLRGRGVKPRFAHCDKDFSEISAIAEVWPAAVTKVQLCLWHVKKAVDRRLAKPANPKRTAYFPLDAKAIIPHLDLNFLPTSYDSNCTSRHSTLVANANSAAFSSLGPSSAPPARRPPFSPSGETDFAAPHRPPATYTSRQSDATTGGLRLTGRFAQSGSEEESGSALMFSDTVQAQMSMVGGVDAVETEDGIVVDAWDEMERDHVRDEAGGEEEEDERVFPETAEGRRDKKQAIAERTAKLKESSSVICRQELRKAAIHLMSTHLSQHPSIPFPSIGHLNANDIYLRAAAEMYDFCALNELADAWAYLWENWYRPARWILWARSSCREISKWRTTMAVERHWRTIAEQMRGGLRSIGAAMHHLGSVTVPRLYARLKLHREGFKRLNWRQGQPRWRQELKALYEKVWKAEEGARKRARKQRGEREPAPEEVDEPTSEDSWDPDTEDIDKSPPPKSQKKKKRPSRPPKSLNQQHSLLAIAEADHQPFNLDSLHSTHFARTELKLEDSPHGQDAPFLDPVLARERQIDLAEAALPPPTEYKWHTNPVKGVCGCPSFLHSRFLLCKHLIRLTTPASRPPAYFGTVERLLVQPFWRIPQEAIDQEQALLRGSTRLGRSAPTKQLLATNDEGDGRRAMPVGARSKKRARCGTGGLEEGSEDTSISVGEPRADMSGSAERGAPSSSSARYTGYDSDSEEDEEERRRLEKRRTRRDRDLADWLPKLERIRCQALSAEDQRPYVEFHRQLGQLLLPLFDSMAEVGGGANAESRGSQQSRSSKKKRKQRDMGAMKMMRWVDTTTGDLE